MTEPRHDPHSWHTKALVVAVYALFVVVALALWGCSTTRTVRVPAGEATVNVEVPDDTAVVGHVPPVQPRGSLTMPTRVVIFRDTVRPTVDLSWFEIDRRDVDEQTVRVRTQQDSQLVQEELQLPAVGEALRGQADSTGLEYSVFGTPSDYTVQADVSELEPPWWERLWGGVRLLVAFVGGVAFGYVAVKLLPGV